MNSISLTVPSDTVTIAAGKGSLTASVTNGSSVPAKIVLSAFGPEAEAGAVTSALGWTTIDEPSREIAAGATEQFAVSFAPQPGTMPGRYPVRLIAYSAEQAPEEYADQAQSIGVIVPEAPAPPPGAPKKKRWWPYAVAAAVLLVVVGLVVWLVLPGGGSVTVPEWQGADQVTVQTEADALELEVVFTERARDPGSDAEVGTVIDQDPAAGAEVPQKSAVSVILAKGVIVPDWSGASQAAVQADAVGLGLTAVTFSARAAAATPGTVIDQTPSPLTVVSPDEPITVVLAVNLPLPPQREWYEDLFGWL